ncbi:MAG: hypothetical protein JW839_09415 [Candidatus Lokiarchaeota archaeon]|nr:hypothetical protein [Candidatus Lokiarchaeota archaeon]
MNDDSKGKEKSPPFSRALRDGMLVLVVFGGFIVGLGIYFNFGQDKYATILYHYNAEYRAGNTAIENATINQAIPVLIDIYYRHPEWKWTFNLQSWAIENMSVERPDAFAKLVEMINRGQCELLGAAIWSYQMVPAFTLDDLAFSLQYTRETLWNLGIRRFSRVVFFQESQSFPGFGNGHLKQYGFDTCMIGTHTLALHGIPLDAPLLKVRLWDDPSTDFNYLPYNWVPEAVEGGIHFWSFLATGETVLSGSDFTTQGTGQGLEDYLPVPELALAHEQRLEKMYNAGYKLMTVHDYVTMLEARHEYKPIARYVPEATWRDMPGFTVSRDDSNGFFTWMGYNTRPGNSTVPGNNDGEQLADTYRTGNALKAIKTLLLATWDNLSAAAPGTPEALNVTLWSAYTYYFKAQGTDPYGWEPSWINQTAGLHESAYSRNNNALARQTGWSVLQNMSTTLGLGDAVQVYTENMTLGAWRDAFENETASWINETSTPTPLTLDSLPVPLSLTLDDAHVAFTANVFNCSLSGFSYYRADITIPASTSSRLRLDLAYPVWYSPSLHEGRAIEYTLEGEEPFFLPISNGLVFTGSEANGIAIIKNCSVRHVALMVDDDWIGYYETTKPDDPHVITDTRYSFVIYEGSLANAIQLARLVNIRPFVTLDVTSPW